MSMAGLDPSGGAGLLADIKTFEAHGVTGFGVCTALTVQTDDALHQVDWLPPQNIIAQALPLLEKFPVRFCKIGIVQHPGALLEIIPALRAVRPGLQFILDPVLKASAGYAFHTSAAVLWQQLLPQLLLLTPNNDEAQALTGLPCGEAAAAQLAQHCAVLLKGGHRPGKAGWDTLYNANVQTQFPPPQQGAAVPPKHGSGCVLSAAITASLALGRNLEQACAGAKTYTYQYLNSSPSLLGVHYQR